MMLHVYLLLNIVYVLPVGHRTLVLTTLMTKDQAW